MSKGVIMTSLLEGRSMSLKISVSQACSQAKVCQFSKKSYGDLDPIDSRPARTFTAFAHIEIIKKDLFFPPKNGYEKDCINRNSRFKVFFFINVVYSAHISRIACNFWAIVFEMSWY